MRQGRSKDRLVNDMQDDHLTGQQRAALWSSLVLKTLLEPDRVALHRESGRAPRAHSWRAAPLPSATH
jgi:hypothetical protein